MNNQQITDPSLINIQNELLNEDSSSKNKTILFKEMDLLILSPTSIRKNIIILCVCIVAFFFLFWVYYKWMCIPIRKHNIQVEHLASADSSATICANIIIDDTKNIDINNQILRTGFGQHPNQNESSIYYTEYNFKYDKKCKQTYPKKRSFIGSLSEIIGKDLYDEMNDTCQKHNLDINKYHGLFYYRHLDNEKYVKGREFKHRIYVKDNITICLAGLNDCSLQNHQRDSSLNIYPALFFKERIDKTTIRQRGYKNIAEGYVLCQNEKNLPSGLTIQPEVSTSNKLELFFLKVFFQMEDISQSYYDIELTSNTISETSLEMDFTGTINCIQDNKSAGTNCKNNIEIDRSSISIKSNNSFLNHYLFLVKFNDMENMQTMRLFLLAALITLTLTKMIKTLRNIYESAKFSWKTHHSRKKKS